MNFSTSPGDDEASNTLLVNLAMENGTWFFLSILPRSRKKRGIDHLVSSPNSRTQAFFDHMYPLVIKHSNGKPTIYGWFSHWNLHLVRGFSSHVWWHQRVSTIIRIIHQNIQFTVHSSSIGSYLSLTTEQLLRRWRSTFQRATPSRVPSRVRRAESDERSPTSWVRRAESRGGRPNIKGDLPLQRIRGPKCFYKYLYIYIYYV